MKRGFYLDPRGPTIAFLFFLLTFPFYYYGKSSGHSNYMHISRGNYGNRWPLLVDEAVLICSDGLIRMEAIINGKLTIFILRDPRGKRVSNLEYILAYGKKMDQIMKDAEKLC